MRLKGKKVLVTGAARRIGRAIVMAMAARGCDVGIHYHRSRRDAETLKAEAEALGVRAVLFRSDFSAGRSVAKRAETLIEHTAEKLGGLDILVNNAAIFYSTPVGKVGEEDWEAFQTINLKVPVFLAQAAGRIMRRQRRGKIINLADWTGIRPKPDYLPYNVSKAGLIAATQSLAVALAPNVQVNAIAPGPILPAEGQPAARQRRAAEEAVLKRYGNPSDIAETVIYLCAGTDFVTGALIPVDGGSLIANS